MLASQLVMTDLHIGLLLKVITSALSITAEKSSKARKQLAERQGGLILCHLQPGLQAQRKKIFHEYTENDKLFYINDKYDYICFRVQWGVWAGGANSGISYGPYRMGSDVTAANYDDLLQEEDNNGILQPDPDPVVQPVVVAPDPVVQPVVVAPDPVVQPVVVAPDPVVQPVVVAPDPVVQPVVVAPDPVVQPVVVAPDPVVASSSQ